MTFWNHLKAHKPPPSPTAVELARDQRSVKLLWAHGDPTLLGARLLRQRCPCAGCVDEMTGKRTLDPESIPEDVRIVEIRSVGNYAVCCTYSDGHSAGIYDWNLLQNLGNQA